MQGTAEDRKNLWVQHLNEYIDFCKIKLRAPSGIGGKIEGSLYRWMIQNQRRYNEGSLEQYRVEQLNQRLPNILVMGQNDAVESMLKSGGTELGQFYWPELGLQKALRLRDIGVYSEDALLDLIYRRFDGDTSVVPYLTSIKHIVGIKQMDDYIRKSAVKYGANAGYLGIVSTILDYNIFGYSDVSLISAYNRFVCKSDEIFTFVKVVLGKDILLHRYVDNMTLQNIAEIYGVTRELIRQKEEKSLKDLKNHFVIGYLTGEFDDITSDSFISYYRKHPDKVMDMPIENLDISTIAINRLKNHDIYTVKKLVECITTTNARHGRVFTKKVYGECLKCLNDLNAFRVYSDTFEVKPEVPEVKPSSSGSNGINNSLYAKVIEDLHLSTRSYNCCKRGGFNRIGDLVNVVESGAIFTVRNMGNKSVVEIITSLNDIGIVPDASRWKRGDKRLFVGKGVKLKL